MQIRLCGPLAVEVDGRRIEDALPGGKGRLLFAYLVLNRDRAVSRDELIDVLWPDDPPASPEAGLSTLLARLRPAVGEGVVVGRQQIRLELGPDPLIDVEVATRAVGDAENALTAGDAKRALAVAQQALEVVRQPLLPGLDTPRLEDHRLELTELEPPLLEVIARARLALGGSELPSAERTAKALVGREPFRESGYALLMEAYARRGNVAEALRVFDRLRLLLGEELGAVPSPEISALHERLLRSGELPGKPPAAAPPEAPAPEISVARPSLSAVGAPSDDQPFVGREDQLALLHRRWRESVLGRRRLVLLAGEPGLGKTRLAGRFAAEVHGAGGTVFYGRSDEDAVVPYQPFVEPVRRYLANAPEAVEALEDELRLLARLIPGLAHHADGEPVDPGDPEAQRYRLFEAVRAVLCVAAGGGPLLLVLDDLHWADKPTLALLRHVLRHPEPSALMVVGTFRDVEVDWQHPLVEVLADLRREDKVDRVVLEGLDDDETATLVAQRIQPGATPGFVRRLRSETAGNPFFMGETLRSLVESQPIDGGPAVTEQALDRMGIPEGVNDVILQRLRRLSGPGRDALTTAAVLGREFRLGVLEDVLDAEPECLITAVEEAIAAGLVVEAPQRVDQFSFAHALVRESIYGQLSRTRRQRLHLQVADALEHRPEREAVHPAEIAHHLFLARPLADPDKTVDFSIRAGERAAESLAYEEAGAHYRAALEVLEESDSGEEKRRCDVLLALGRVQWQAGDPEAREAFWAVARSAKQRHDAEQLACAALGIGERYWEANVADVEYRRLLEEVLEALSDDKAALRARVMGRLAENLHFQGEEDRAAALSREAVETARGAGNRDALVTALMCRHVTLLHIEHLDERLELMQEARALSAGHRELAAEGRQWHLYDLFELGDFETARREQVELERLAHELRQPLFHHLAVGWQSVWAQLAGDTERAEQLAYESLEHGKRARTLAADSTLAGALFQLRREQGRFEELLPLIDSVINKGVAVPIWRSARSLVYLEIGEEARARDEYERFARDEFANVPRDFLWLSAATLLADTCAGLEDAAGATILYEQLRPYAHRNAQISFVSWRGPVAYFLGLLATTLGDRATAGAHFEAALERSRSAGAPVITARTQLAYARLLRGGPADARERATELAADALLTASSLGMDGLARRTAKLTD